MGKWVPGVALIGLVCVMIIPAPGLTGILIGALCVLAIALSAAMMLFERAVDRFLEPVAQSYRRWRTAKKSRRRALHAGSGMVRKT